MGDQKPAFSKFIRFEPITHTHFLYTNNRSNMLFIQQVSVLALLVSAAFAAVIPQDKATKAANLKRVIADRQFKRASIGKRTIIASPPQVSQTFCAGYRNLAGVCVEKCDLSLSNVLQKQSGGCQCAAGFEPIFPFACVSVCTNGFIRNPATNQCGCDTSKFDLLSTGFCVDKCNIGFERFHDQCLSACPNNVKRGSDGSCNTCENSDTNILSEILTVAGLRQPSCVARCNRLGYLQNPSGGCLALPGAKCNLSGVTCQGGLKCGFLGICNVI